MRFVFTLAFIFLSFIVTYADRSNYGETRISLNDFWQFKTESLQKGQQDKWFSPELDDKGWDLMEVPGSWELMNETANYIGKAGYRIIFKTPVNLCVIEPVFIERQEVVSVPNLAKRTAEVKVRVFIRNNSKKEQTVNCRINLESDNKTAIRSVQQTVQISAKTYKTVLFEFKLNGEPVLSCSPAKNASGYKISYETDGKLVEELINQSEIEYVLLRKASKIGVKNISLTSF